MSASRGGSLTGRRRRPFPATAAAACVALFVAAPALAETWQVDLSVSFARGTYGSEETTSIVSVPLTVKNFFARGEASATFPFVSVDTQGEMLVIDGTPQDMAGGGGAGTVSGLGDIVVKGKFYALEERGSLPSLDLVARVKLPTAVDGLGTGEPDAGLGVDISHRLGARHLVLADAMYTFIGDPPETEYQNRVAWDLGLGWQPRPGATIAFYYDYRSSLKSSRGPERSALLFFSRRVRPGLRLYGLLEAGFTDAASDVGLTAGVKYSY